MRIKGWIQISLDSRQIDAVVFETGMVAHHGNAQRREKDGQEKLTGKYVSTR